VIIRKKKHILTSIEEKEILHDIIRDYSAIKDFFIYAHEAYLLVYHSQFNYTGGQEANLSRKEAIEYYGPEIERWMRFHTSLKFKLVDAERRLFQAERVVYMSLFGHDFYPIGEPDSIEHLAKEFGQHLGRESFFNIDPVGWEE
jgi:hypothetical protein